MWCKHQAAHLALQAHGNNVEAAAGWLLTQPALPPSQQRMGRGDACVLEPEPSSSDGFYGGTAATVASVTTAAGNATADVDAGRGDSPAQHLRAWVTTGLTQLGLGEMADDLTEYFVLGLVEAAASGTEGSFRELEELLVDYGCESGEWTSPMRCRHPSM